MPQDATRPRRHKLPHCIPSWILPGSRHFITINARERGGAPLTRNNKATRLIDSARFYEDRQIWYLWLMVVMPDHVHFIASFDLNRGVQAIVSAWKRYQATHLGIEWQADFFEHRVRNDAEFDEKAGYIRMNPVRNGLVLQPDEWPHIVDRRSLTR